MTRPSLIVGALAAVCVGMLLWCARLILAADLPRGAHVASWVLWAVATVAALTLMAYLREFLTHRQVVGREASWKPLPSLVLLWIGGLTALVSFAFILPDRAASDGAAGPAKTNTSLTGQTVLPAPATTTAAPGGARQAPSTTSSRSVSSRTVPPAPVSTTAPRSTPTGGATASRTSATTTTPSTTTSPLIDIHILPPPARPTTPPGR